jgi:hypothetical protein
VCAFVCESGCKNTTIPLLKFKPNNNNNKKKKKNALYYKFRLKQN